MDGKDLPQPPQHQVFINFRGEELRYNFIEHLQERLKSRGINVFIDTNEDRGENISNLFKRIEDSKIALVVFSNRYTQSMWCLDELAKIKERVDVGMLKVIPIFYKIATGDVKHLQGDFGYHFREQERKFRYGSSKIDQWKAALESISGKHGMPLTQESSEYEFLGLINKEVLNMLARIESKAQTANSQANPLLTKEVVSSIPTACTNTILHSSTEPLREERTSNPFNTNSFAHRFLPKGVMSSIPNPCTETIYSSTEIFTEERTSNSFDLSKLPTSSVPCCPALSGSNAHTSVTLSGPARYSYSTSTSKNGGPVTTTEKVWYGDADMTMKLPSEFLLMHKSSMEDIIKDMEDRWPSRVFGSSSQCEEKKLH